MGRKLKRVTLEFNWDKGKVWKGFINPYRPIECPHCKGDGMSPRYRKISNDWYTHLRTDNQEGWGNHLTQKDVNALVKGGRLWDFCRIPITDEQKRWCEENNQFWTKEWNGYTPTAKEVNEWNKKGVGHDGINQCVCSKARAKRKRLKVTKCTHCKGKGYYFKQTWEEKANKTWKKYEPPTGDGYQLWETTTEGSPLSPVFASLEELCEWCETNANTFADYTATKVEWMNMLSDDHVHHTEGNCIFI